MQVELVKLRPNPLRDFTIDPIDPAIVTILRQSIHEYGFWGGIACRRCDDGTIEMAAGHHRVLAAIEEGVVSADVFVRTNITDEEMVRLYAMENATQRTNTSSTAVAGSVASAIHVLAKQLLTGCTPASRSTKSDAKAESHFTAGRGIGEPMITEFLYGVPGITKNLVTEQLANLKASGDYARILVDVEREIQADHEAVMQRLAMQEAAAKRDNHEGRVRQARVSQAQTVQAHEPLLERVKQVVAKAVETPRTFDFEGVAKYLTNAKHVAEFRKMVTGPKLKDVLVVEDQAPLAAQIVARAKRDERELSTGLIKEHITGELLVSKSQVRQRTRQEHEHLVETDRQMKAKVLQDNFLRSTYSLASSGKELIRFLHDDWPAGEPFLMTQKCVDALMTAKSVLDELVARMATEPTTPSPGRGKASKALVAASIPEES